MERLPLGRAPDLERLGGEDEAARLLPLGEVREAALACGRPLLQSRRDLTRERDRLGDGRRGGAYEAAPAARRHAHGDRVAKVEGRHLGREGGKGGGGA